ncbi:MAG: diguanylate cyclase [Sedimentibacter sp.]
MEENKNKYENFAKIMLKKFIPAITLIVLLVIAKHVILQHYIQSMDMVLQDYEIKAIAQLQFLEKAETLLFFLILSLIVFLTLFIFIPTHKGLSKAFYDIQESNENIMKLFKIVHGAMFLIESETCEVMLMNKQAEELINVEYKDGIYINDYLKFTSRDFCDVINTIKENEHKENMDIELILNENEKMYAIVTSVRTHFSNKDAVLIGLFDISLQKQSEEAFKNIAIKDNLTGLYNRYYFEKRVNDKIEEADKYDEPISMLMLDLDYFKNINDTYGHPVGDEVLKLAAETLKKVIRQSDYIFRVGGEEFAVLMPKTNINAAVIVAEKVRFALESAEHHVAGKITASIGVAERLKFEILDDWYKRVDKALYCAKEGGRNCVVNYGENNTIATVHIEWNKEWDSGNKVIDKQHMELVELGNSLIFMNLSNYEFDKVLNQLDKLIEHVVKHFKYEENMLEELSYSNYEEHVEIHNNLLAKANELKKTFLNGEINTATFFSFVVDDIVIGHMVKEDKKFYDYVKCNTADLSDPGTSTAIN